MISQKKPTDSKMFKYVGSDVVEKIIKNCRGVKNVMME